ncbi:MAG: LuxR C-terminal-related transcriptional regulator [Pseudomonas sp.]|uniref:LuxR C-terminal-related transcriptional regulator n=1 Tax=Pseudomonas sp. TaxID=306 RepID=UPI0039826193
MTPREKEIVQALARGQTSKHIARQLGISPRTVEKHRENCMRKLNVHDLSALLHYLHAVDR